MLKFLFMVNFLAGVERSNQPHLGWTALAFPVAVGPKASRVDSLRKLQLQRRAETCAGIVWLLLTIASRRPYRGCFEIRCGPPYRSPIRLTLTASEKGESASLR